jgi:glycosyltransferase involved in cell wall biosynthesis
VSSNVRPAKLSALASNPRVSAIVTSYNYAGFISAALDTVLGQDYRKIEVVVADDGSSDAAPDIVWRCARVDPRVRLITGDNAGQPRNTNRGVAACLLK